MKACSKCQACKPISEFHLNKRSKDGRQSKCKECAKANSIAHRAKNADHTRAYDKARDKSPIRAYSLKGRVAKNLALFPERNRARLKVFSAIKSGKLKPLPCFSCGAEKVDAHHPDYSSPLDVVWLCRSHHMMVHAMKA